MGTVKVPATKGQSASSESSIIFNQWAQGLFYPRARSPFLEFPQNKLEPLRPVHALEEARLRVPGHNAGNPLSAGEGEVGSERSWRFPDDPGVLAEHCP